MLKKQIARLEQMKENDAIDGHQTATKSIPNPTMDEYMWNGEQVFFNTARSFEQITDKVTDLNRTGHHYDIMYGQYLLPYYARHPNMKMLEIGLGCDMIYGPGASAMLHKKLFPQAQLWEAEYNATCVHNAQVSGDSSLDGINILTGDQGNVDVLDRWIDESGGNFDVIIDDGGHRQCQIWTSFLKLWPELKPGGLYFIEDLQVAKDPIYRSVESPVCSSTTTVPDNLKKMMDDLIYSGVENVFRIDLYPFSAEVKFMFCQSEACVLGKKSSSEHTFDDVDDMKERMMESGMMEKEDEYAFGHGEVDNYDQSKAPESWWLERSIRPII